MLEQICDQVVSKDLVLAFLIKSFYRQNLAINKNGIYYIRFVIMNPSLAGSLKLTV